MGARIVDRIARYRPGKASVVAVDTVNDAAWFRDAIQEIFGEGAQSALARFMLLAGDARGFETVLRSISNTATGRSKVSGEMRVILALLRTDGRVVRGWLRQAEGA